MANSQLQKIPVFLINRKQRIDVSHLVYQKSSQGLPEMRRPMEQEHGVFSGSSLPFNLCGCLESCKTQAFDCFSSKAALRYATLQYKRQLSKASLEPGNLHEKNPVLHAASQSH